MRRKKTTLSRKLLLAFLGSIVCIVMAVTLVGSFLSMFFDREVMINAMYISQVVILVFIIIAFYHIVDRLIVQQRGEAVENFYASWGKLYYYEKNIGLPAWKTFSDGSKGERGYILMKKTLIFTGVSVLIAAVVSCVISLHRKNNV